MAISQDWASSIADDVLADADRRGDTRVTIASGISPSGPVHLGNLREVMVPHFVADEIRRRGVDVRHIFSWDDYDRFRKVPAGFPESFAEHIGRPLTAVPDPCGRHDSWAEHHREPFEQAMADLGVELQPISQTQMYCSGAYAEQIQLAMERRAEIGAVLAKYQTKQRESAPAESGAPPEYFPFLPYCGGCGRDHARVTAYDDATTHVSYDSPCGHQVRDTPIGKVAGKLAWKVDWPMRWAYERVNFESAGVDHSSPGSSFTVGSELVRAIFDAPPPVYVGYSFVGNTDSAKMSSSAGRVPTPTDALRVIEAPIVRWLYGRRRPNQSFSVAFGQELTRLYDEWDAALTRHAAGTSEAVEAVSLDRALATATSTLAFPARRLPFRTLASVVDVAAGDSDQILRIVRDMTPESPVGTLEQLQPRLDRARAWIEEHVPAADRTHVRSEPNAELLGALTDEQREALRLLVDGLAAHWSLDGLTTLLYGIPKQLRGLPADTAPTPELKAAQRAWFSLLYQLLTHRDTGPRLPTLLLAIGDDRTRALLAAPA